MAAFHHMIRKTFDLLLLLLKIFLMVLINGVFLLLDLIALLSTPSAASVYVVSSAGSLGRRFDGDGGGCRELVIIRPSIGKKM